jgi:predicted small lipoprotein YifL
MENMFTVIFIGLFMLSGCGQTGPLKLPEKSSEKSPMTQQKAKSEVDQQTNITLKKTS